MIRILVVEDDEKLNQIICAYLTRNQYQAKGCRNLIEAYELMYAEMFDLIISDIVFDFIRRHMAGMAVYHRQTAAQE